MGQVQTNIVERAFELASECLTLKELRERLHRDGYGRTDIYLSLGGRLIRTQLTERLQPSEKQRRVR